MNTNTNRDRAFDTFAGAGWLRRARVTIAYADSTVGSTTESAKSSTQPDPADPADRRGLGTS